MIFHGRTTYKNPGSLLSTLPLHLALLSVCSAFKPQELCEATLTQATVQSPLLQGPLSAFQPYLTYQDSPGLSTFVPCLLQHTALSAADTSRSTRLLVQPHPETHKLPAVFLCLFVSCAVKLMKGFGPATFIQNGGQSQCMMFVWEPIFNSFRGGLI